jgi:environmental stress-induced protein Ves
MTLQVIRCDQVEPQAWRNGGGQTRELLAWPGREDWQLRISVADIDRDGPFSPYPGIDRWVAVVEGAGVRLQLPGGARSIDTNSAPLHFHGEDAPGCDLLDGPTRDLNLMVRRGQGLAAMQRAEPGADLPARAAPRALFCADAVTLHIDGSDARVLAPFSLLWCAGGAHGPWRLHSELDRPRAWWLSFQPAAMP